MKKYIYIAIGGFAGAILRYWIKNIESIDSFAHFPMTTLLINIIGSFILAYVLTRTAEDRRWNPNIILGVTSGLLGAFTTFSTLCKEVVLLILSKEYSIFIFYIFLSVTLGLMAAYIGTATAKKFLLRKKRQ